MNSLLIRVCEKGGKPAFPELTGQACVDTKPYGVAILEEGTSDGKCAIGVVAQLPDESYVLVQFTESLWRAVSAVLESSCQRFAEKKLH